MPDNIVRQPYNETVGGSRGFRFRIRIKFQQGKEKSALHRSFTRKERSLQTSGHLVKEKPSMAYP